MTRVDGDRSDQKPEVDGVNIEINVDGETSDTVTGVDGEMSDQKPEINVKSETKSELPPSDLIGGVNQGPLLREG